METKMTLGKKIKSARLSAGLTQEELANKLVVSRQAVTKWEADKGLPDIENLKQLSKLLDVSIDYLLDDVTSLDFNVIKKPINLNDFTTKKITAFNRRKIKNSIIRKEYPNAEIYPLIAKENLTKAERVMDTVLWLTVLPPGTFDIAKECNNADKAFYLVNDSDKQYLVMVTNEYIESRAIINKINESKFKIGNFRFTKCTYTIK
jgi:transcriptional regulator with XRE-family HTH domain